MRKLNTQDLFAMSRILKKVDVKKLFSDINVKDRSAEDVGKDMMFALIADISNVEKDLYQFMGNVLEITPEEVEVLELDQWGPIFKEMAEKNNLANFIKQVRGLTKQIS